MVLELKKKDDEERLSELNLQSLYYWRDRGNMIECYKMLHDAYNILKREDDTTRRGHYLKLKTSSSNQEQQRSPS